MRILIVEDDENILRFLKNSLAEKCFEVDAAIDGEKGSFLARTNDYDLIILDRGLPKKNGEEVCTEIRKDGVTAPILILSVQSDPYVKADCLNIGADDYVSKPFSFEELLARVQALLRRPKKTIGALIKIGKVEIDTERQMVTVGAKPIYLTVKEYSLLEYLARNRGKVISRGLLMEHAWDMNADLFSNAIEVHVSNIRRKLGEKKIIKTLPGRGYVIN